MTVSRMTWTKKSFASLQLFSYRYVYILKLRYFTAIKYILIFLLKLVDMERNLTKKYQLNISSYASFLCLYITNHEYSIKHTYWYRDPSVRAVVGRGRRARRCSARPRPRLATAPPLDAMTRCLAHPAGTRHGS